MSPPLVRRVPVPYGIGDWSVSQTILPGEFNSKCARRFPAFLILPLLYAGADGSGGAGEYMLLLSDPGAYECALLGH